MNATRTGEEVGGMEPAADTLLSYTLWSKANLFVGPEGAVRSWDLGDGFDSWAEHFIPAAYYAVLSAINDALAAAIAALDGGEPDAEHDDVTTVIENLQTLASTYNVATDFDPDAWEIPDGSDKWRPTALG